MLRIAGLLWNESSIDHLWAAHQVAPEEIDEVMLGIEGDLPAYRVERDGKYYAIYGATSGGRLLLIVGELMPDRQFRPFAAREMTAHERRKYRKG